MSLSARILRAALPAALLAVALAAPEAHAGYQVTGKPKVQFNATGNPGYLDIEGLTNALTVKDDGTNLSFVVPMKTISTGIDLRDEHMNEKYVEVGKFPDVSLSFPKSAVPFPTELGKAAEGTVKAQFTAHGVAEEVDVAYVVKRSKTGWRVQASFPFDVSAHGIAIPSYLSVTVDPKMKAVVTFDLTDAP